MGYGDEFMVLANKIGFYTEGAFFFENVKKNSLTRP